MVDKKRKHRLIYMAEIGDGIKQLIPEEFSEWSADSTPDERRREYNSSKAPLGTQQCLDQIEEIESQTVGMPEIDAGKMERQWLKEMKDERKRNAYERFKKHFGRHPKNKIHEIVDGMENTVETHEMRGVPPIMVEDENGYPIDFVEQVFPQSEKPTFEESDHFFGRTRSGKALQLRDENRELKPLFVPIRHIRQMFNGRRETATLTELANGNFKPTKWEIALTKNGFKVFRRDEPQKSMYGNKDTLKRLANGRQEWTKLNWLNA